MLNSGSICFLFGLENWFSTMLFRPEIHNNYVKLNSQKVSDIFKKYLQNSFLFTKLVVGGGRLLGLAWCDEKKRLTVLWSEFGWYVCNCKHKEMLDFKQTTVCSHIGCSTPPSEIQTQNESSHGWQSAHKVTFCAWHALHGIPRDSNLWLHLN